MKLCILISKNNDYNEQLMAWLAIPENLLETEHIKRLIHSGSQALWEMGLASHSFKSSR